MKKQTVTLPWMDFIRTRMKLCSPLKPEVKAFILPILLYGEAEERRIARDLSKNQK